MSFRGRFALKLDPKSRLSLPSEFREVVEKSREQELIITNGQNQGRRCLEAYLPREWKKLEKKISRLPQFKQEVQIFQRFYLSGAHRVNVDSQFRILLPQSLKSYASLKSDVVVVGFSDKFEIWSESIWSQLFEQLSQDFEKTQNVVAELLGPRDPGEDNGD